jgi:hypothetical protein
VSWKRKTHKCVTGRWKNLKARFLLICDAYIQIIFQREYFNQVDCAVLISTADSYSRALWGFRFFVGPSGCSKSIMQNRGQQPRLLGDEISIKFATRRDSVLAGTSGCHGNFLITIKCSRGQSLVFCNARRAVSALRASEGKNVLTYIKSPCKFMTVLIQRPKVPRDVNKTFSLSLSLGKKNA